MSPGADSALGRPQQLDTDLLRSILHNLGDVVVQVDHQGKVTYVSPSSRAVLGYEPAELLGKPGDLYVHPDDLPDLRLALDAHRHVPQPNVLQYRYRHANGRWIWVESMSRAILDKDGKHLGRLGIRRDISQRKSIEQDLMYSLQLEAAIARAATRFANVAEAGLADGIGEALANVGRAVGADRAYVFTIDHRAGKADNTHEWCAPGIAPEMDNLQGIPLASIAWWIEELSAGRSIDVPDVAALPVAAAREREILEAQEIHSVLVVPMRRHGQLTGFLGFDSVRTPRTWSVSETSLLSVMAGVIATATERAKAAEAKQHSEQLLRESEQRYERLTAHSGAIIFTMTFNPLAVTYINHVAETLFGITMSQLQADPRLGLDLVDFGQPGRRRRLYRRLLLGQTVHDEVLRWQTPDGAEAHIEHTFVPVRDNSGKVIGVEAIGRDITDRVRLEAEIRRLGLHDQLTGLANRALFEQRLRVLDAEEHLPLSIIIADVNGLKLVNDTLGHEAGDRLLQAAARALRSAVRSQDVVARLGGDEFGLLLPGVSPRRAASVAARINGALAARTPELVSLNVAMGVATKTDHDQDIRLVQRQAEDRMYHHKAQEAGAIQDAILAELEAMLRRNRPGGQRIPAKLERAATVVSKVLNLSPDRQADLAMLVRIRNIGQVTLPAWVWRGEPTGGDGQPSLDDVSWGERAEVFRQHAELGYRIAKAIPRAAPIAESILAHHERWDGNGYPRGLQGNSIPQLARIWRIVVAHAHGGANAVAAEVASGNLDPRLAERFLRRLPQYQVAGDADTESDTASGN